MASAFPPSMAHCGAARRHMPSLAPFESLTWVYGDNAKNRQLLQFSNGSLSLWTSEITPFVFGGRMRSFERLRFLVVAAPIVAPDRWKLR